MLSWKEKLSTLLGKHKSARIVYDIKQISLTEKIFQQNMRKVFRCVSSKINIKPV